MDGLRYGRIIGIPIVIMVLVAGIGIAAPIVAPPQLENLVEGHTVFTVIEQVNATATNESSYAAAVAVLVREIKFDSRSFRFPGVVWFNDQYLVNPHSVSGATSPTYRYPCQGAVIATGRGAPDPTTNVNASFIQSNYVESYQVRDPNDFTWTIDKWNIGGNFVWSVALNNDQTRYNQSDNGVLDGCVRNDNTCAGPTVLPWEEASNPSPYNDSGPVDRRTLSACMTGQRSGPMLGWTTTTYNYPCGGGDTAPRPSCSNLRYNALLFFLLEDLTVAGAAKNHSLGSPDSQNDASGCDANSVNQTVQNNNNVYPCPGADDEREGYSHAYNPERPYPFTTYAGRGNHGGSADCTGDAVGDQYCHATRQVDIYYARIADVPIRTMRFTDAEGVTAPYHCHETRLFCNQAEVMAAVPNP